MISSLFKSKKVIEAEKDQHILEKEIKRLSLEIVKKDGFLKCKNDLFISCILKKSPIPRDQRR